ncbi:MAG: hypothetical protein ACE5KM_21900 [Planctomycetaceae bacterium]
MSKSREKSTSGRPVLSHTSILIVSAFLIGIVVQNLLLVSNKVLVIGAAGVGLLGYLALDLVAARRRERDARLEQERLDSMIDNRMKRHQPTGQRSADS